MDEEIIKNNNDSLKLRIVKALAPIKQTSERVVGLTAIDYSFDKIYYKGTTIRPVSITPIERAIVGIIDIDGYSSINSLGIILGFDVEHDTAERLMLGEAVEKMKSYGVLEGDESFLALTEKGKIFAKKGERPETYSKDFCLLCDRNHIQYTYLLTDFEKADYESSAVSKCDLDLDIEQIKTLAEQQAPDVQNGRNRYILQSASIKKAEKINVKIYVAFLQSIRDENDIRAIVYEDSKKILLPHFTDLINSDKEWFDKMLSECIQNELQKDISDGGWESVSIQTEKGDEQKAIEQDVILNENKTKDGIDLEENELERLHKKALYDQTSFEIELENIFKNDNPDEVWLVSPWVGWEFINRRVPQFLPLLKSGKRIFIAYSEAEENNKEDKAEMIKKEAEVKISRLNEQYQNFYCLQLPPFHTKQVIEVKNGQSILFNGSFNVLSFSPKKGCEQKVRREEMALVHHKVAIAKHQEYVETFASIYMQKELNLIRSLDNSALSRYKNDRIDYLRSISSNKEIFVDFYAELEEKQLNAQNLLWYEQFDEISEKIIQYEMNNIVELDDYKTTRKNIDKLLSYSLKLTINKDIINKLATFTAILEKIPRERIGKKKQGQNISTPLSDNATLIDKAKIIIQNTDFSSEIKVQQYVAALNLLYHNRQFNPSNMAFPILNKLIRDTNAMSFLLAFDYRQNVKNEHFIDITIGIGKYAYRFYSIAQDNVLTKLSKYKKPLYHELGLEIVKSNNINDVLSKLIN